MEERRGKEEIISSLSLSNISLLHSPLLSLFCMKELRKYRLPEQLCPYPCLTACRGLIRHMCSVARFSTQFDYMNNLTPFPPFKNCFPYTFSPLPFTFTTRFSFPTPRNIVLRKERTTNLHFYLFYPLSSALFLLAINISNLSLYAK